EFKKCRPQTNFFKDVPHPGILKLVKINNKNPDEYIVKYAKNKFSNKEKYMEIKEQYKQWYRFEPKLLKAIGDLNLLYYKLAKLYFKDLTKIRSEIDNFLDNNEIDNIDKFLSKN
ncbi:33044_t:CDS:2, partial [Gigaspora margarita]